MKVHVLAKNIFSPLGTTSEEQYSKILDGNSGIKSNPVFGDIYASCLTNDKVNTEFESVVKSNVVYTKLEKMFIFSISKAISDTDIDPTSKDTIFIISTTKGNIDLLEADADKAISKERIRLAFMANQICSFFKNPNKPFVISNACISGVQAILFARMILQTGKYKHAIVSGGDILSPFIISGFNCLMAISSSPCRPFDSQRSGITLGEAAATVILSTKESTSIEIGKGFTSNDANHISGPSRTGDGLLKAIVKTIDIENQIDFISAHGTATLYNDEMEAKALDRANLVDKPIHSLKGYFGHTLGAAGILESIICMHSLETNQLVPSFGFEKLGVSVPLNIIKTAQKGNVSSCLKTASGFGGCNAAMIISKNEGNV